MRLRRAEVLAGLGPDGAAAASEEVRTVVAFWRRADATWCLHKLREWAAAHRIACPRLARRSNGGTSLTPRERQVADLVASGLTNREIAQRLVIAERTAEDHVEHIRNKLGLRNRAHIAARVVQSRSR